LQTSTALSLPPVIGHRGAQAHAPENTLAGLRTAHDHGAAWVEVDVKLTRDGVPILMHDDDIGRTTDGIGPVAALTLGDIRRLDAGSRFSAAFAGEKVPTLEEALALILDLGLGVNLEIKPCSGREAETAQVALDLARRLWPAGRPLPLVSSFEMPSLEAARDTVPDWPRGLLIDRRPADWRARADHIGAATLNVNARREDATSIAAYRETGRPVLVYTVNDGRRARALFAAGVTSVFSDKPREILAALKQ
jgi:glycerophosphoryl diester phosphodiesterase